MDLRVQVADELELGLGPSIGLALVEDVLGDLELEDLGWLGPLEDAVLTEAEEALKDELGDGEADNQSLPREEGSVEKLCETLFTVWSAWGQDRGWAWSETHLEEIHLDGRVRPRVAGGAGLRETQLVVWWLKRGEA